MAFRLRPDKDVDFEVRTAEGVTVVLADMEPGRLRADVDSTLTKLRSNSSPLADQVKRRAKRRR